VGELNLVVERAHPAEGRGPRLLGRQRRAGLVSTDQRPGQRLDGGGKREGRQVGVERSLRRDLRRQRRLGDGEVIPFARGVGGRVGVQLLGGRGYHRQVLTGQYWLGRAWLHGWRQGG